MTQEAPKEESEYRSQYDYVDKDKAYERGIPTKQNYAYRIPLRKKKRTKSHPEHRVAVVFDGTSTSNLEIKHGIELKSNRAYQTTDAMTMCDTKLNEKASCSLMSQKKEGLKPKTIYAPPIEMRIKLADDNEKEASKAISTEGNANVVKDEYKESITAKPIVPPRAIYEPPSLTSNTSDNLTAGKKQVTETQGGESKGAPKLKKKKPLPTNATSKPDYSYVATSINKNSNPFFKKNDPGIQKMNCVYTGNESQASKAHCQGITDRYVRPVMPPSKEFL